ncbi:hypothetical protein Tco_0570998 [Tanacetum coccineum]
MWTRIINSIKAMHDKGIILHSNMRRKLSNGASIKFSRCLDSGILLKILVFSADLFAMIQIAFVRDRWFTALVMVVVRGPIQESISDTNSFSIKGTHVHIDNFMLPDVHSPTRWIRCILKKVNIMIWRALRDRLPTCWNLSRKASEIWHKVFMWLDHLFPVINSFATIFEWVEDLRINSQAKHIVQSI